MYCNTVTSGDISPSTLYYISAHFVPFAVALISAVYNSNSPYSRQSFQAIYGKVWMGSSCYGVHSDS